MNRRTLLSLVLGLGLGFGWTLQARGAPTPVAVAAAGDLRGVLEQLKATYEGRHPEVKLQLSFGASGSLTAQIQQGAPFDIFLAADSGFPEALVKAGLVSADGLFPYATGSLVLWLRRDLKLDPKAGLSVLLQPTVRKVASANPQLAPYGRAGEAALRQAGLFEAVKARLVLADNIAQAAQWLQTGAAEAGLISFAQASHPALARTGLTWKVPADAFPPLRQSGVILKRSACLEQARAFMAYLVGAEGQALLAGHGYGRP
jgi:molybdate transport system substrate-binding protein